MIKKPFFISPAHNAYSTILHLLTNYDVRQHQISQTGCLTSLHCRHMLQDWHWTARQAVWIDICSCFSVWIILWGCPIFSCFGPDASSPFIYSTTSFTARCGVVLLVSQTHLPCAANPRLSVCIYFGTFCNSGFIWASPSGIMNVQAVHTHSYWHI